MVPAAEPLVTRAVAAANGALQDQMAQMTAATSAVQHIDGTYSSSSRNWDCDRFRHQRTGRSTRVAYLVNAWRMPGAT